MTARWLIALLGWTAAAVFLVGLVMPSFGPDLGLIFGTGSQILVGMVCGLTGSLFANWVEDHFADRG